MKAPGRQERDQSDMGVLIEAMLELRNRTNTTVAFVHHQGHQGDHMRGSSDLESAWETKLKWKREGNAKIVTIEIEHREAEPSPDLTYRISWDPPTRTMRLDAAGERASNTHDDVLKYLAENPGASGKDIVAAVTGRATLTRKVLEQLEEAGTISRGSSQKRDTQGRPRTYQGYFLPSQTESLLVPDSGNIRDDQSASGAGRPSPLRSRGTTSDGTTSESDLKRLDGDPGSPFDEHDHAAHDAYLDSLELAEDAA